MTTFLPALINPVNAFAASSKPQWMKEAISAAPETSFRNTLVEASQRTSPRLETGDKPRLEAREKPKPTDRPEPPEPREASTHEGELRETAADRTAHPQTDEARPSSEREVGGEAKQSGEGRPDASQSGDSAPQPVRDTAQSAAQQPTGPAQGLLGMQLVGVGSGADQPQLQMDNSQNGQVQNAVMATDGVADRTAGVSTFSTQQVETSAEPASGTEAVSERKDSAEVPPTRTSTATLDDLLRSERGRDTTGTEAERPIHTVATRSQEQTQPTARSSSQQTTANQQSADATTRVLTESASPDRESTSQDRDSGGNNQQSPRWTTSGKTASTMPAAVARAEQVDTAVRLENATAQAPTAEASGRAPTVAAPAAQLRVTDTVSTTQVGRSDETAAGRAKTMSEAPFASRVIRGLTAMINQRGGVMNMRLEPPDLGDLRVQMTIARGQVSAHFQVTTAEAHAMLDKSLSSLRAALESHGLTVERLHVQTPTSNQSQDMREGNEQQNQQARDHADAGGGQSRGRSEGEEPQDQRGWTGLGNAPFADAFAASAPVRDDSEGGTDQ